MIIGVTGKSGSGKSYFCKEIIKNNKLFYYIDVDLIQHESLEDSLVKNEIIKYFDCLENNVINRKKLSNIVFKDKNKLKLLNEICTNYVYSRIDNIIKNNNNVIIDWALLEKSKYFKECDIKILLDINKETRFNRIKIRDKLNIEEFNLREENSLNYNKCEYDYVIENEKEIENVLRRIYVFK